VGYLGYDVVREVERLPDVPPDDLGHPDAALVVIGQFCAFDHWRQRIVLVDNVVVPETGVPEGLATPRRSGRGLRRRLRPTERAGGGLRPAPFGPEMVAAPAARAAVGPRRPGP
jgi:anthranilate/para-aminobenzoate synthase component I